MDQDISGQAPVAVSDAAVARIATILRSADGSDALRISVEGGGCSGFSYKYDLTSGADPDDVVIERDGARVLIDQVSLPYLSGSIVDFVDDLMGQSFQIRNPNAVAACGCGTSFSI
ncbi:iron-sulfur cluster assembly accessory protein [Aureimonas fodinaquatilis]|uniref:Iron-sulfur cluster assembly accessory protein n=1 Tax=Aureimonas fodinaquatilis TaxID=2565783 RepID=A0A5B0DWF9_9HYPH|nr:iron-sulfur cluster assembly accessory protein [Aureimonas fodinaquatilis]KAA0970698.1 iron-sulfur cluster assembly accessory protein [Aureimonas fodinaquatilis]